MATYEVHRSMLDLLKRRICGSAVQNETLVGKAISRAGFSNISKTRVSNELGKLDISLNALQPLKTQPFELS